jgi:hypothetical protein
LDKKLWVIFIIYATSVKYPFKLFCLMRISTSSADLKHFQLTLLLYQFRFMNRNSSKKLCFPQFCWNGPDFYALSAHNTWYIKLGKSDTICWHVETSFLCSVMRSILSVPILTSLRSRLKVPKICPAEKTLSSSSYHTATWYEFSLWFFVLLYTHTHTRTFHKSNMCHLTDEY